MIGTREQCVSLAASVWLISTLASCSTFPGNNPQGVSSANPVRATALDEDRALSASRAWLREWALSGGSASVLIAEGHEILLAQGFGTAERTSGRPITNDTLFDIGSLVKEITAVAVLQLVDDGQLQVSDTLSRFFPDVPFAMRNITVEQLLAHRSGLPDIVDQNGTPLEFTPEIDFLPLARKELVARIFASELISEPGTEEHYSNFGYGLLAVIVEIASGEDYNARVRRSIFSPLGMTSTGYDPVDPNRIAVGYQGDSRWGSILDRVELPYEPSWVLKGSGGMLSTPTDLFRFFSGLNNASLLSPEGRESFLDLFAARSASGRHYVLSFGSNDVFEAGYFWDLDRDLVLIAFTNDSNHTASEVIQGLIATTDASSSD